MEKERAQEIQKKIEEAWKSRYLANKESYGKQGGRKYQVAQGEFFVGAMAAINAILPNEGNQENLSGAVPPWWVIAIMSGRDILKDK